MWRAATVILWTASLAAAGYLYVRIRFVPPVRRDNGLGQFVGCVQRLPGLKFYPYPISSLEVDRRNLNIDGFQPPATFDHRVSVQELHGRYLLGWEGATMWFNYPPSGAMPADGCSDMLDVTLCFGEGEHRTYRVRRDGSELIYAD